MSDIQIALPFNVIPISLSEFQTNGATTSFTGSTRVTRTDNTRVTRGGNTRVTRDFTVTTYPEMTVVSVSSNLVPVVLPEQ